MELITFCFAFSSIVPMLNFLHIHQRIATITIKLNNFITKNTGLVKEVLIEKHPDKQTGLLKGVTSNYLTVLVNSKDYSLHNTLAKVKILHRENGKIYSELMFQ